MKLISWNINGIRAVIRKNALQAAMNLNADILCFQETKFNGQELPQEELDNYKYHYFHHADRKGYSGTGILSKTQPLNISHEFPNPNHDHPQEGRVITAEFDKFFLVNVYTPNSKDELLRLHYRENAWDPDFRTHVSDLAKSKPVIACGDFNVAHQEIDIARPDANRRTAGFTDEERNGFTKLLDSGFIDTFRHIHPDATDEYSWWSFRANARARNVGWRIDYFITSDSLKDNITNAAIHQNITGSDHAPVSLEIEI